MNLWKYEKSLRNLKIFAQVYCKTKAYPSFKYAATCLPILTFITDAFCLVAIIASTLSSLLGVNERCVTKASPTHFIDSKCHIKKLKRKSPKTCLTNHNHTGSISHFKGQYWMIATIQLDDNYFLVVIIQ